MSKIVHIPTSDKHRAWMLPRQHQNFNVLSLGSAFARFIPSPGRITPGPPLPTRMVIQTRDYRKYRVFTDGSFRRIVGAQTHD